MLTLLTDITTIVLLTAVVWYFATGLLQYWRGIAMMNSMYVVSQDLDTNQRSAVQYEFLNTYYLEYTKDGTRQIAWSIIAAGVIIVLRLVAGALYAYL
ncbi:hypothetical protein NW77_050 [Erwinia phage phiEa2809]|uniref:Uncharacterized protein n=1 Tax=Erwinia phage phiEa2809 TaxID=1564096 RepID=A0A0A0YXE0_9CAUD|nr:hypothetical protein NW77_050 [Erwinia phage phiEa2809]AIX13058.1 hypothetical protein NW77_050 [Erwinia phage phiEa2809]